MEDSGWLVLAVRPPVNIRKILPNPVINPFFLDEPSPLLPPPLPPPPPPLPEDEEEEEDDDDMRDEMGNPPRYLFCTCHIIILPIISQPNSIYGDIWPVRQKIW